MLGNSDESVHYFGKNYFTVKNSSLLDNFIQENGMGIVNIDLVTTTKFHLKALSNDAREMCEPGTNAGGESQISEGFSFELFHRCLDAALTMTETQILNRIKSGPIVDYVFEIDNIEVGVSVTRAMKFPRSSPKDIKNCNSNLTEKEVKQLLRKKLQGVADASNFQNNRINLDSPLWKKQILHVWVQNEETAQLVYTVADEIQKNHVPPALVVISVAEGSDFIFSNKFNTQN